MSDDPYGDMIDMIRSAADIIRDAAGIGVAIPFVCELQDLADQADAIGSRIDVAYDRPERAVRTAS